MLTRKTSKRRYQILFKRNESELKMDKKSQAAMEYLTLTGLSMLILLILLVAVYERMSRSEKSLDLDSAERAAFRLKEAADFVYIHGHPTKLTIPVYLPGDIESDHSYIANNTINIAMRISGAYTDVWKPTRGDVSWDLGGSTQFPTTEGYYLFVVESTAYSSLYNGTINIHE